MPQNTRLWHKEYAGREGRRFDLETVSLDALVEQGWVDSPAKLGMNVWGGPDSDMNDIKGQFERKEVPAIGKAVVLPRPGEEAALHEAENKKLYERLRVQEDENTALKRELREAKEKLADHRSDAAKLADKHLGTAQPDGAADVAAQALEAEEAQDTGLNPDGSDPADDTHL